MKRGKERVEMLRAGVGLPRERLVDPIVGKKTLGYESRTPLLMREFACKCDISQNTTPERAAENDTPPIDEGLETATTEKVMHVCFGVLSNRKIPRLANKKVRLEGRVPKILVLRTRQIEITEEPESVEEPAPAAVAEPQTEPEPIEEPLAVPVVKVVPTPKRPRARTPKVDRDAATAASAQKPLKVIRRRREQSPIVFETMPKSFPKAMLEGVDFEAEENNHRHID